METFLAALNAFLVTVEQISWKKQEPQTIEMIVMTAKERHKSTYLKNLSQNPGKLARKRAKAYQKHFFDQV